MNVGDGKKEMGRSILRKLKGAKIENCVWENVNERLHLPQRRGHYNVRSRFYGKLNGPIRYWIQTWRLVVSHSIADF